ncbi:MAG TPA: hypothetical protein DEF16_14320 [Gemmobacter sp.]|nr:MAG: hypothetical protein A2X69_08635 [Rhodobacteraceae bacterium GWF1_65_7]HBD89714.1 hypothetical protein [Gemmobacter sp.]HBU15831.1 hypothetical protein [Gemmobacter sp.]
MTAAERITRALRGRWHGRYGLALCPAHANTRTPALSLADAGDGRLLARCHAGCSFAAILEALQGLGLVEGTGHYAPPSAADLARIREAEEAEARKREAQARNLWQDARPIPGTMAETYLRTRGISCPLPEVLRFHPECWHGPTARRWPALVALVEGCDRLAVHRTYLRPDGQGKAAVEPVKMMLGATAGGAVRLVQAEGPLVVAEGIETALSLASGLLRTPAKIWAALSAPGIAALRLSDLPGRLIVATDGDEAGRTAGNKLAGRATALGWQVSILPAPDGRDWNDILTLKGGAA